MFISADSSRSRHAQRTRSVEGRTSDEVHRHVYNYNSFQVSRKEADGERDATEVPSSVWMKTIREICGHIRSHADSSRPEGCSNCYMTLRRLWDSDLALALLTRFIFGFGACSDVLYTCTLSFPVHPIGP